MQNLKLTITLASDAQPGSGIGAVGLDQCLPRDLDGRPMLQASHLKGLLLDALRQISDQRNWSADLAVAVFGAPDSAQARVQLTDARASSAVNTLVVSRTAVDDEGTKRDKSLRTVEAMPCGMELGATIRLNAVPDSTVDLAFRLAALSVAAVGGDRNRGAGACQVVIEGEERGPGELLLALAGALSESGCPSPAAITSRAEASQLSGTPEGVLHRVVFIADGPICCPVRPVAPGNTITSGIAIPASAVQGLLLTRLNEVNGPLASACFADKRFRAWPLLPVALAGNQLRGSEADTRGAVLDTLPNGLLVSLAHRISKLARPDGTFVLGDSAIAELPENDPSPGSPLKQAEGVLLTYDGQPPRLWRSGTIPRVLSTHGVHRDGDGERNLFSVLALAPMIFTGLVSLPAEAADALARILETDDHVSIGKARSVRGGGRLILKSMSANGALDLVDLPNGKTGRVFIVQSPLVIPDAWRVHRAEETFASLAEEAGWPTVDIAASRAESGLRFGWNRHGLGTTVGEHRRLRAQRCIEPGSVIVLDEPLGDARAKLLAGIGAGREAGFGALLPHPGIAQEVVSHSEPLAERASDGSGELALALWSAAGRTSGPSASQIGALRERLADAGKASAQEYLRSQKDRPARVWQRWEHVYQSLVHGIDSNSDHTMVAALRGWQDLAVTHKEERQ